METKTSAFIEDYVLAALTSCSLLVLAQTHWPTLLWANRFHLGPKEGNVEMKKYVNVKMEEGI